MKETESVAERRTNAAYKWNPDYINVNHLSKSFAIDEGDRFAVFENISFNVKKGEFICIVGSSGCGKSTLLRALSGLDPEHGGNINIDGLKITRPGKERGVVFQEPRLFPWLTVERNILFALDSGSKEEKRKKVKESIELVGLTGFEKNYPKQLSGGMAQRTNIARALVNNPPILFLDEPFGALDAFTKIALQNELLRIKQREGSTMLMVTHDIDEAVYLSDRVIVMGKNPGGIKEIISVDLPRPRDRNAYEFTLVKKRIYDHFFETQELHEEYNI